MTELNANYYCPITQELMQDPVMDSEGNSFERAAIEEWLSRQGISPLTRTAMTVDKLVPNRVLKAVIDEARSTMPTMRPNGPAPLDMNAPLPDFILPEVAELSLEVISMPMSTILPNENAQETNGKSLCMANIIAPANAARVPTDIIVCIDTSGSMGMNATANGVEDSNLDMLDIVKHAVKTIIKTLNDDDRLGIVGYANAAVRTLELEAMDEAGKTKAIEKLIAMQDGGMTNLWDGLKTSMEMLYERDDASTIFNGFPSKMRNSTIYLLTDGVPNVDPPRGYVPAMQRFRDQHGGKYPGVLNTFGFGYNLKSDLLLDLACEGQGSYALIPDSGFVGTVFVNALGNTLTTLANECIVSISTEKVDKRVTACTPLDMNSQSSADSIVFHGKTMQIGQPYGSIFLVDDNELPLVLAKIKYVTASTQQQREISVVGPSGPASNVDEQEIAAEYFRSATINLILEVVRLCQANDYDGAKEEINRVVKLINDWLDSTQDCPAKPVPGETKEAASARAKVMALKEDITGQITEASSKEEWFAKWGLHFLRSIMRAHQLKQCNNFKDPGVQVYGNTIFTAVRDDADDIFSALPPPVKKRGFTYQDQGAYPRPTPSNLGPGQQNAPSMSSYNDRNAGCFHGKSLVTLLNGEMRLAEDVSVGDVLNAGGVVKCVVKTMIQGGRMPLIRLPQTGLLLTPYHPVMWEGLWQFPVDIGEWVDVDCDAVYSYLVESGCVANKFASSALINGVPTAMLGHGVDNIPCLSHPFFGTKAVVEALQQCPGYCTGLVLFTNEHQNFVRHSETNDVCGIDNTLALAIHA